LGSIRLAFVLNLGFAILELVGGLWMNSVAVLSDAIHDLGDSLSLGIAWYLSRYAQRGVDRRFSYGYRRFSLLSALITGVVLLVGSALVLREAVPRLVTPQRPDAQGMALLSLLGIAVNGLAAWRLHGGRTMNARLVSWHLLEDVLGWVAVLLVSVILLFTKLYVLDPLLSVVIASLVVYRVGRQLWETAGLFLQAVPGNVEVAEVEQRLVSLPGVTSTHHTHVLSLDGVYHVLSTHIRVQRETTRDQILAIKERVRHMAQEVGFEHTTLEIEYGNERCAMAECPLVGAAAHEQVDSA
jgi:cobalt-zinc-cadmium efflux system protein